tara:strand:- start:1006 stop:1626 length:621 start_codon:yes stop_codon:yes gene_type:complete
MWNAERKLLYLYKSSLKDETKSTTEPGSSSEPLPEKEIDLDFDNLTIDHTEEKLFDIAISESENEARKMIPEEEIDGKPYILIWNVDNFNTFGLLIGNDIERKLEHHVKYYYLESQQFGMKEIIKEKPGKIVFAMPENFVQKMIKKMGKSFQFQIVDTKIRNMNPNKSNTIEYIIHREDSHPENEPYVHTALLVFTDDLEKYKSKE